jgi:hypothetical protein
MWHLTATAGAKIFYLLSHASGDASFFKLFWGAVIHNSSPGRWHLNCNEQENTMPRRTASRAQNMSSFVHKFARGMVLVLILVLTGSANMLCVSVDNDDDDDTPPVSIELSIVAPSLCHLPNGMAGSSRVSYTKVKPPATGQQTAPSHAQLQETAGAGFRPLRC